MHTSTLLQYTFAAALTLCLPNKIFAANPSLPDINTLESIQRTPVPDEKAAAVFEEYRTNDMIQQFGENPSIQTLSHLDLTTTV